MTLPVQGGPVSLNVFFLNAGVRLRYRLTGLTLCLR